MKCITPYSNQGIVITMHFRCGSTYLYNILADVKRSEHQNITMLSDWQVRPPDNDEYLELVKKDNNDYIVKSCSNHAHKYPYPTYAYNIMMLRLDVFDATLSYAYARLTDIWNFHEPVSQPKISIKQEFFEEILEYMIRSYNRLLLNNAKIKYDAFIEYENLTFDPVKDLEFFGINKKLHFYTMMLKGDDKQKRISNYNELKDFFLRKNISIKNTTIKNTKIIEYKVRYNDNSTFRESRGR